MELSCYETSKLSTLSDSRELLYIEYMYQELLKSDHGRWNDLVWTIERYRSCSPEPSTLEHSSLLNILTECSTLSSLSGIHLAEQKRLWRFLRDFPCNRLSYAARGHWITENTALILSKDKNEREKYDECVKTWEEGCIWHAEKAEMAEMGP